MSTAHGVCRQAAVLTADSFYLHFALGGGDCASASSFHLLALSQCPCESLYPSKLFFLPIFFVLFNHVTLHSLWAFREKVLVHLLSRAILRRGERRRLEVIQDCDMKTSMDHPNWGFRRCQSLLKLEA